MPHLLPPGRTLRRVALAALLLSSAALTRAQYPAGAIVQRLPSADDPGERLATALRTLAVSPNDLSALIAAGQNALVLGDPNAAVGFFGRAGGIAPRDGRAKAGLASALVQLERSGEALRLFGEAAALGVPDADVAADRGLAYDLTGNPQRAQRDYAVALAAHPEDEQVRRRLALSQGIAGDRKAAIATLDPLIRKRDIAGWRAQTFVLAMTGDTKGANDITRIMIPQQQAALQPFLQRLASLSPADKARAVHFGEMPAAGRSYSEAQLATIGAAPTYAPPARPAPPVQVAAAAPAPAPVPRTVQPASPTAPTPQPVSDLAAVTARPAASSAPGAIYPAAPLAGIALAPAATPTAAAPAPSVAVAQTAPPPIATTDLPPSASPSVAAGLPVGSTGSEMHFDRPHDVAPRVAARPAPPRPIAIARTTEPKPAQAEPVRLAAAEPVFPKPETPAESAPKPRPAPKAPPAEPMPSKPKASPAEAKEEPAAKPERSTAKATPKKAADEAAKPATSRKAHAEEAEHASTRGKRSTAREDEEDADSKGRDGKGGAATTRAGRKKVGRDEEDSASAKDAKGSASAKKAKADEDAAPSKRGKGRSAKDDEPAAKTGNGRAEKDEKPASKKGKSGSSKPEKAVPARVYVQVAGGANKDDLDKAWTGVRKQAPELMKGRTPTTTPLRFTNRLMVGPFKDEDEAQAFVNKAAGKGLSTFVVKTDKGQKVEKVDTGK